jgi:hypothetical protein
MTSSKSDHNQAKFLEKKAIHPYSLQGMGWSTFIDVANKILAGEFGLINFRRGIKVIDT